MENNNFEYDDIPIMIKYSNKVNKSYVSMSDYNNSALSEYLASRIINLFDLSIKAHDTLFINNTQSNVSSAWILLLTIMIIKSNINFILYTK